MTTTATSRSQTPGIAPAGRLRPEDCHLDDLLTVLDADTEPADYPHADRVEQGVLFYSDAAIRGAAADDQARERLEDELTRAMADGPGIVVFERAFAPEVVDRATSTFQQLIAEQHAAGGAAGDHFAKPGANDRVWNALEKLAVRDPETFVDYYAAEVIDLAARAWLGAGYQVTSTINVVNPGGAGQTVHRDYHLGFQSPELSATYPAHVHALSPVLTLQGAVAHCDMPVESGPTLYLPHSQKYSHGYLAYWLPEFQDYFVQHHIQLPLAKGDVVFFNPALFHAAGANHSSDIYRMANLLQISSPFGRAMESVDRARVVEAIYPTLLARQAAGAQRGHLSNVIASSAEGYAFPTNLDRDQPVDGMSPRTQAEIVQDALSSAAPPDELGRHLAQHAARRASH